MARVSISILTVLFGAAPATFQSLMGVGAFVLGIRGIASDEISASANVLAVFFVVWASLGFLGVYGLWLAAFRDFPVGNRTVIYLIVGLIASAPFWSQGYSLPMNPTMQGSVFWVWFFNAPPVVAAIHILASLRRRKNNLA